MCSFRSVLILATAVLPSASAQSVCQTGWTQGPSTSDWGNKCYREVGITTGPMGDARSGGYNQSACKAECKSHSATARMLCLTSASEANFVSKQAHMDGWVAYTQDTSSSDYAEPAGGWGWECGSTYVPTWGIDKWSGIPQPDNMGDNYDEDVSCAVLGLDGMLMDFSCRVGDGRINHYSRGAQLGLDPRCYAQIIDPPSPPLPFRTLRMRGRPDDTNLHRLRGPKL